MKILKNIFFLFLLTHFTAFSQYVYEENFDGKNSWTSVNNDVKELKMYNGRYYFEHKKTESYADIQTPTINLNTYTDFEIETSIQKISGVQDSGISFMYDYKDGNNFRELGFATSGYFRVAEAVNGEYKTIKAWTKSDKVKTGNFSINKLKITKKGNIVTFFINDAFVHSMPHRVFMGSKMSLTLYKNQKVSIDYIKAKNTSTSTTKKKVTTGKTILFEGFNDNKNAWASSDNENVKLEISNGNYIIDHKRESGGWNSTISKKFDTSRDFKITAQIKKESGILNNGYGIIFGRKDNKNQNEFFISGSGSYIIKKTNNGTNSYQKNWTKSSDIKIGNGVYNYLKIEKIGSSTKYYINSKLVFTTNATTFYGDRVGFIVYSKQAISVGYLSMSYLDGKTNINPNPNPIAKNSVIFSEDLEVKGLERMLAHAVERRKQ